MTALHDLPATELAPLYRSGQLSPVEVTRAVLGQVARCEPQLNASYALRPEAALAMAEASQARWLRGQPLGPLDGVPVTLKENISTVGVPSPIGCAASLLNPAAEDAPPAARLREAGAVFICKTTMPDWGMLSSGLSSLHGITRNPWDTRLNPGGSSAGAGAAAAAGYGPLHLGTDIGGSIRLPASWCGVVGFKPSLGRIPIKPPYAGRVAGPLARTVADVALAMQPLSRPDWRDAMSLPPQDLAWSEVARATPDELRGLRIGLWLDAGWGDPLTPEVRAAVLAAARAFEAAGAVVEPLAPFATLAMVSGLDVFWRMRSWLDYSSLPAARQAKVLPYIRDWITPAQHFSAEQVFRGHSQIAVLRDATVAATQAFDFVISPVSPDVAFPAEWPSPGQDPTKPFEHIAFTLPWNMSEQPALALNAGYTASGLPIGLHIAGRRHDDLGVLRLGRIWEQLRGAQRAWPGVGAHESP